MNSYISAQIKNMEIIIQTFQQSCRMAAVKDDGIIDKAEAKQLEAIDKACKTFIKALNKVQ